jgi:hypothetical protein
MTKPATKAAAIAPSAASSGTPKRRHEQRVHLTRRGGTRVDPVDDAEAGIRDVVVNVDDGQPAEQLGVILEHPSDSWQVTAVAHHDQVVLVVSLRIAAENGRSAA